MLQEGIESLTNTMYMIWWHWIPVCLQFLNIESKYYLYQFNTPYQKKH